MKKFLETKISGVYEIDFFHAEDMRGSFVKTYHKKILEDHGLTGDFHESFYSTNQRGVVRGMHFQFPPHEHAKIVYCTSGRLTDVILDIRIGSPTFGQWAEIELTGSNHKGIYIPVGMAHGFVVLEDNTTMVYLTSTMHNPDADAGIHIKSFGYNWPVESPICSVRDLEFPDFKSMESPFIFT